MLDLDSCLDLKGILWEKNSSSPQRLYKDNYEKTKAKNHIPPDMLEILSARNTQNTVSGINYRKYLHQWICMPDMQMYVQARKVNEQLSDVSDIFTTIRILPQKSPVCL